MPKSFIYLFTAILLVFSGCSKQNRSFFPLAIPINIETSKKPFLFLNKTLYSVPVYTQISVVVDEFTVTEESGYSMLRIRCRWLGETPMDLGFNIGNPYLTGIEHPESKDGYTWFIWLSQDWTKKPGKLFELNIKNPPQQVVDYNVEFQISSKNNKNHIPIQLKLPLKYQSAVADFHYGSE
jgi:hypothetical protein